MLCVSVAVLMAVFTLQVVTQNVGVFYFIFIYLVLILIYYRCPRVNEWLNSALRIMLNSTAIFIL